MRRRVSSLRLELRTPNTSNRASAANLLVGRYELTQIKDARSDYGEQADATLDFLGNRRIHSLRLHPRMGTNKKAIKGSLAASSAGRTSARVFRSRR